MKNAFIIILLTLSTIVSATDYYISSSGDDTNNNGLSSSTPWKTIAKVNSVFSTFKPGDRVLFNRGDTFYGTLKISSSGIAGNPIVISAYGSGAKPVISGFTTLSSWTNQGSGIYNIPFTCTSAPEIVTIDGVQYGMGRWPNSSTWAYIDSHSSVKSISDMDLNSATINWAGAELVIRQSTLNVIGRYIITDHSYQTLTFSGLTSSTVVTDAASVTDGFGYFIQNDIRTLDIFGEWYYNTHSSLFYMFFGTNNPNDHKIQISSIDNLIDITQYVNYIDIINISFKGANKTTIKCLANNHITIESCDIDFSGNFAIEGNNSVDWTISNNIINHTNDVGIFFHSGSHRPHIIGNEIYNSGLILGAGNSDFFSGRGMYIFQGDDPIIEYNKIFNSGYGGINFAGNNALIRYNLVDKFCIYKADGGGIAHGDSKIYSNMSVTGNIVLNGIGGPSGLPVGIGANGAAGIYIDYYSTGGIEISNNTVAHCVWAGILISGSQNIKITNNTVFDCLEELTLQELAGLGSPPRNVTTTGNIFFAKSKSQLTLRLNSTTNDFSLFGSFNNNYYARPIDNLKTILPEINWNGNPKSLAEWQTFYGQDLNSKISPITLKDTADIDFYYNATKKDTLITLVQPMIDVTGKQYISSVTLAPFTSVVLMVDPNPPVPVIPVYVNSIIQNLTPTKLEITYSVNLDPGKVPSVSDFLVKGTTGSVNNVTISGTKVILTLSAAVAFGDVITLSYSPGTTPLQTPSLGKAVSLTDKAVTNNLVDPAIPNDPPKVNVIYSENAYSGFVYELDASGTTDSNNDILTYTWTTPSNIPVSITTGPKIKFLSPIVTKSEVIDFGLSVDDGKATQSKNLSITLNPYKPELGLAKSSTIAASNYYLTDYPNNVIDGDLTTKWSANGDNHWLLLSLSEPFKISHLQVALLPDQKYESYFDIYVSKDNSIWEPVLIKNATCNFSGAMQTFDFPAAKTGTEYSFVKLIGHGNSLNTWNNYSELKLFGSIGESSNGSALNPGNISIYPNPASDLINILILEPPSESQLLQIYDMTGAMRFESQLDPGVNNVQIPINLNSGIYIAEVMMGKLIMFAQKLLVIK
jgi:parallel beta-helix repeat protein